MAIKRSKSKEDKKQLPNELDELLIKGFTCAVLHKRFEADGKIYRKEVVDYLENNDDGFEVEVSKSFKTEYGSVNFKQRSNEKGDPEKLIELFHEGKLTIETLVNLGTFSAAKLRTAGLGAAIIESDPTEYLELRASTEFKNKINDEFDAPNISKEIEVIEEKPKKKAKKKVSKKDSEKRAKAKVAAAKVKSKVSVEDELDAILAE